jgi:hypothetical protein
MRNKRIKMHKVQWSHRIELEATWEREEELRQSFHVSFLICPNLGGEIHFQGVGL